MAEPNIFQRGLNGMRETMKQLRGDGKPTIGQQARRGLQRAKAGFKTLKSHFGFSDVDLYNEDIDQDKRRKRAREFLFGDDDGGTGIGLKKKDVHRDLGTISPEYRAQVSAGLAAANSMTTGSTLVGGAGATDDADERW